MTSRHAAYESHPSIDASMDDFEAPREFSPTVPDIPSQHSGFRSNAASEYSEASSSRRSYSPPTWRKAGSGWFKHHSLSPTRGGWRSTEASPQYHSAEEDEGDGEVTAYQTATKIPLPASPTKGRSPSNSPELGNGLGANIVDRGGGGPSSPSQYVNAHSDAEPESPALDTPTQSNCKYLYFFDILLEHDALCSQTLTTDNADRLSILDTPRCGAEDTAD